jgi:sigma-B regulation protein RsbU (phosphoserine phosphatase)
MVSGDYCDLLCHGRDLFFVVGDVTGKGVSAALLMAHLHATFRVLVSQDLKLEQIMTRANRIFCESSLTTHFATLACGKADMSGKIEFSSAGHEPALVIRKPGVEKVAATGLPLGMFCSEQFSSIETRLDPGETILLYTDGLTESRNPAGDEYGIERLVDLLNGGVGPGPRETVAACHASLEQFRLDAKRGDDLTIMAIQRPA